MKKSIKTKLKLVQDKKTTAEINSIILKGIVCSLNTLFKDYYVSENIESLMKYINDKAILSTDEYKRLLCEAKDFYPVIICALFVYPLKSFTKMFKEKELKQEDKKLLFEELNKNLIDFFIDWLCVVDIDPLLFYRLASSYNKKFNLQLYINKQINHNLTPLEEQMLKIQIIEIISLYLVEQVAIQLGLAGLDYIDYYSNIDLNNQSTKAIN